jgi:hypothetical protein
MHIDYAVMKNCINPDSYGTICVGCNACGRINKDTQKEAELKLYKDLLQEQYNFDRWAEGMEELQKKNIAANIEYFKAKITELEGKQ